MAYHGIPEGMVYSDVTGWHWPNNKPAGPPELEYSGPACIHRDTTTVVAGACKNCGGDVMTKYKYGMPDIACMSCGFGPDDEVR